MSPWPFIRMALPVSLLACSLAPRAAAQETLTLAAAVQQALQGNSEFRSSQDAANAARARANEARAGWLPRLDFSQGFTRGDNPVYVFGTLLTQRQFTAADLALPSLNTPEPLDNFQTMFSGQWNLFDSGQTHFRSQGAKRLETAADFDTEQARQDLIMEVVRDYYGVLVTREDWKAAGEALQAAESNEQREEKMHTAGLIVDSDLLSAKVFLAQMKDREIRAHNGLELAQMTLARVLGEPPSARPEPSETLIAPAPAVETVQRWTQTALAHRPSLRSAELQAGAAASATKSAKAEFGPKIGVYADFERDAMTLGGPSGTNWTAGARLDINLFAGGAQRARMAEAQANEDQARHSLEWLRSGVQLEVQQAYLDISAAAQRAAAAHDAVAQAQESLRIIQNRYEAGLTNITELLRAQTAQLEARTEYLSALHDWQVARAQLERSAGVLTASSALLQTTGAQ